jgi:hypothetical protein
MRRLEGNLTRKLALYEVGQRPDRLLHDCRIPQAGDMLQRSEGGLELVKRFDTLPFPMNDLAGLQVDADGAGVGALPTEPNDGTPFGKDNNGRSHVLLPCLVCLLLGGNDRAGDGSIEAFPSMSIRPY